MKINTLPFYFNINRNVLNKVHLPILIKNACPDAIVGILDNGKFNRLSLNDLENVKFYNQNFDKLKHSYQYKGKTYYYVSVDYCKKLSIENIIIICLESPHEEEFENNIGLSPGHGDTGKLFWDYINSAIFKNNKLNLKKKYFIIFFNPVQFQCSNGQLDYIGRFKRDIRWISCLENNKIWNDFKKRIKIINPNVIINLCTKGVWKIRLNKCLAEKISADKDFNNIIYAQGTHPSSWVGPNNIVIKF